MLDSNSWHFCTKAEIFFCFLLFSCFLLYFAKKSQQKRGKRGTQMEAEAMIICEWNVFNVFKSPM